MNLLKYYNLLCNYVVSFVRIVCIMCVFRVVSMLECRISYIYIPADSLFPFSRYQIISSVFCDIFHLLKTL